MPLPEKVRKKIELLFQHCIELKCAEMHLTMEEEEKWKSKDSHVMESDLSSSGGEEEDMTATMLTLIQKVKKKITMEIDRQISKGEFLFY